MLFAQPKRDYLNWLLHEAKMSDTTHTTYRSWLNRYERWLSANGFPGPILEDALAVSNLRRYQPKKAEGRRLTMSDPEALALLDAAARQCDPRKVAMSVALVSALLRTGVRADELVNIKVADVLLDQEELLVSKGKGGKKRKLFPAPEFFVTVRAWLHEREKMGCEHDFLWAQGPRRGISYEWLLAHTEDLKAIAGYKGAKNIKPQMVLGRGQSRHRQRTTFIPLPAMWTSQRTWGSDRLVQENKRQPRDSMLIGRSSERRGTRVWCVGLPLAEERRLDREEQEHLRRAARRLLCRACFSSLWDRLWPAT